MREDLKSRYKYGALASKVGAIGFAVLAILLLCPLWIDASKWYVKGIGFVITGVIVFFCLNYFGANQVQREMKKYGITEDALEYEYQQAEEVVKDTVFVGRKYMIFLIYAGFIMYKIEDIVWIYKGAYKDKYGKENYYLVIYFFNKTKKQILIPSAGDDAEEDQVMYYFSQKFPHVVVGYSKETEKMFKKEYERFLQIKYYPGLKKEKEGLL